MTLLRLIIARVVNVGASLASCKETLGLMTKYDYIYGAIGGHPSETGEPNEENLEQRGKTAGSDSPQSLKYSLHGISERYTYSLERMIYD